MDILTIKNRLKTITMKTLTTVLMLFTAITTFSQSKYLTRNGHISFFSKATLENIEAHNYQVGAALNSETGELVYKVTIRSFEFEKALMQEHFNENYMHSDKFPTAIFEGSITNVQNINFNKNGVYDVNVQGKLTIHGVTKEVAEKGKIEVKGNKVKTFSKFFIELKEFDIKNDKVKNISERIEITVDVEMDKK
jgi:polyisoprenoid-binding protein YceI